MSASSPPGGVVAGCTNTCEYASDGECDDGGPDALYDSCSFGTDCADCGVRGVKYSGDGMNYGPGNALTGNVTLNTGDTISFTSDWAISERGFKICSYQGARSPADRPALPTPLVCAGRINENRS